MENVRKTLKKYYFREIVCYWLVFYMLFFFGIPVRVARADPNPLPGALPSYNPGDYAVGAGGIGTIVSGLNSLTINSVTNGTAIYIDNHDIGSLGTVTYNQVSGGWALVKINETLGSTFYGDGAATGIAGTLIATENFIMVNNQGILSAPGSLIQARNLVGSAMRITDTDFGDFANGTIDNLNFYTLPGDVGSVINNGTIDVLESVYLVAKNVANAGTIVNSGGLVVMAAGDSAIIGRPGSDVVVEVAMTDPANRVVDNSGSLGSGKVILAAGDIFSTAISGIESLAAEAEGDITLNDAVTAEGDITLIADADTSGGIDGGDVHAQALTAGGNIDISASDETINLHADVTAGGDILLNNTTEADAGITLDAGDDVVLAGGKTLTGAGALTVEADDDIMFGVDVATHETTADVGTAGDVSAGTLTLDAGDDIYAHGTLTSTVGNVDIYADGRAYLMDDVTAYSDLILHDRSEVSDNVVLTADHDVRILAMLEALGNLTIEATTGGIDATDISMNADNKLLTLTQNNNLHMEDALQHVINSEDTDLLATSTGGSVTSSKADTWQSIEAQAATFINLDDSDTGGDITTKALTTATGDILITSDFGKVYAEGPINSGQDVKITAKDESSYAKFPYDTIDDAILLIDDVSAVQDILLNNNTWAAGGVTIDADRDVKVGYDEIHPDVYNPKTLTGDGALTVKASRDIILGGAVAASDDAVTPAVGDLILMADADTVDGDPDPVAGGDMIAYSTITNPGGDIDIYSSDSTTYLHDDVTAGVDILLNNNTVADAGIKLDAGQDVILANTKTLDGKGALNVEADRHVTLGGPVTTSVVTAGNLILNADAEFDGTGNVHAKDTVTNDGGMVNPGGNINISGRTVDLDGAVTAGGDLTAVADEPPANEWMVNGNVTAQSTLDAGGNIDITADDNIDLQDVADAGGNITLVADKDNGGAGNVDAHGLVAGGYIDISASDYTIYLHESADLLAAADVDAGGDILLRNSTKLVGDITLHADDDVVLAAGKSLGYYGAGGTVTVEAGDDIMFGVDVATHETTPTSGSAGNVTSNEDLILTAGDDIYAHGWLQTFNGGNITATAEDHINLYNTPTSAHADGTLTLTADNDDDDIGNLTVAGALYGNMALSGYDVTVVGIIDSAGTLDVDADHDIQLKANVKSASDMTMDAGHDIILNQVSGITESAGSMALNADKDNLVAGDGHVKAYGLLKTTNSANGDMTIESDCTTYLYDGAQSAGEMTIIADYGNNWATSGWDWGAVSVGGLLETTNPADGDMTVRAAGDVRLTATPVSADAADNMLLEADTGGNGADLKVSGNLLAGGNIDLYSSDTTTYLSGDLVKAVGNVTLHNDTELDGGVLQTIEATTGSLYADGYVRKTSTGNLDMFGGSTLGTISPYSVYTREVRAEGGELNIHGNGYVRLAGDIYSSGDMRLAANEDGSGPGYLYHSQYGTTIQSLNGEIDMSAKNDYIYLYGGTNLTDPYVSAAEDILLRDSTYVNYGRKLYAGDDIVLASGEIIYGWSALTLEAGDDIIFGSADVDNHWSAPWTGSAGNVTANGHLTLTAGDDIYAHGLLKTEPGSGGNITATAVDNIMLYKTPDSAIADGTLSLTANTGAGSGVLYAAGNLTGNMYLSGYDVTVLGNVTSFGTLDVDADDDIELRANVSSVGEMTMDAGDDIKLNADSGDTTSNSNMTLTAGKTNNWGDVEAWGTLITTDAENGDLIVRAADNIRLHHTETSADAAGELQLIADTDNDPDGGDVIVDGALYGNMYLSGVDVTVYGDVISDGTLDVDADDDITLKKNVSSVGAMTMDAGDDIELNKNSGDTTSGAEIVLNADIDEWDGTVYVGGNISANGGNMEITGANIKVKGDVYANGNIGMNARETGYQWFNLGNVSVNGDIDSTGNVEIFADDHITLGTLFWGGGNVDADGYVRLIAHNDDDGFFGNVKVYGDIDAGGFVEIDALDSTIYLYGDIDADDYIWLMANTEFEGWFDQYLDAGTWIQADGYLKKLNNWWWCWSDGSLYLHAADDIILNDYVKAAICCPEMCWSAGGGVSIISDNGRIYTDDGSGTLNVDITGRSDHYADVGVDLPFGGEDSGKAAIVVMSGEDLKLGPDGKLTACGTYYDDVDDRVGVGFLDVPATIGDVPRDEGDPFDAAIYVASKGDVDVSSPVSILSRPVGDLINGNGRPECEPKGAMIVDARDTVTFDAAPGGQFLASLAGGDVGDRLEVCSRITEWLFQAVDAARLPFATTASAMSTLWYGNPDSYILRGAGLDNPAITDGRAWVLENPAPSAPLYREAGEPAEEQEFAEGGCPALMEWLAAELGIEEEIQIFVANTFAYSTDIQPCEICARLRDAATILEDPEGTGVAALAQVVNEFVAPDVPPSTEQMTLIAAAFAEHVGDGTYYAAAGQWIDAVAAYVGILNIEMGYSVDDSAAFAGKYVAPVTETGNASLITYVEARLAALGG